MARVVLTNVAKIYSADAAALSSVNVQVQDRELIVVTGPAGCGKSTLLRLIAGFEQVSSGDILIGDRRINDLSPVERDVAMVVSGDTLYPGMTAFQNIAFGLERRKFPKAKIKKHAIEAAEILGIEKVLEQKSKSLSPAQRQRVALARAIARQPKVILLDEPFAKLDGTNRAELRTEIVKIHQRLQATTVFATADPIEAMTIAERIIILEKGIVEQTDAPLQMYDQPANVFVAGFLGRPPMNFLHGEIRQNRDALQFREADGGTISFSLPSPQREIAQKFIGKAVILGVRPEEIELAEYSRWNEDSVATFPAIAEHVEPLGGETLLHLQTGPHTLVCRSQHALDGRGAGRRMQLKLNIKKTYLFDAISAKRIA